MDYLTTYLSPAFWLTDLQCTEFTGADKQWNLQLTFIVTVAVIPVTIIIMSLLRALWEAFRLICRRSCSQIDKDRFKNSLVSMMGICMYLLYPEVIMNLLLGTSCFKSLAKEPPEGFENANLEYGHLDTKRSRMTMLPDDYCFDENYMSRYGYIVIVGILVYVFLIPIYFMI